MLRSYDALLDLWFDEEEKVKLRGGADAAGRNLGKTNVATARASAHSIDVCRNVQVVSFLLLELSVLDRGQAAVVATSLQSATRILHILRRKGSVGVESDKIDDSILEDLRVESTSNDIYDDACLRYRWSTPSASLGVSLVMDRAAMAAEADELWRMAHTPVPNEEDG